MRRDGQLATIRLEEFFTTLQFFLEEHINRRSQFAEQIRLTSAFRTQPGYDEVEMSWDNLNKQLTSIGKGFSQLSKNLGEMLESHEN